MNNAAPIQAAHLLKLIVLVIPARAFGSSINVHGPNMSGECEWDEMRRAYQLKAKSAMILLARIACEYQQFNKQDFLFAYFHRVSFKAIWYWLLTVCTHNFTNYWVRWKKRQSCDMMCVCVGFFISVFYFIWMFHSLSTNKKIYTDNAIEWKLVEAEKCY